MSSKKIESGKVATIAHAGSAIIFSLRIATTKFFDLLPDIERYFPTELTP